LGILLPNGGLDVIDQIKQRVQPALAGQMRFGQLKSNVTKTSGEKIITCLRNDSPKPAFLGFWFMI
jgi:hypothetical protein